MPRQKIILDCDPGHDDAIAILLAARSPALELRAITVVAGNQTLDKTLDNAIKVCDYAGIRDVPIAAGMSAPLSRAQVVAGNIHGESGLDGPVFPTPTLRPVDEHAVDLITREVLAAPGEIVLVPVGPLTNIATALLREKALAPNLGGIVLMGGGVTKGNITPVAEFNIYADPEAAHVVFEQNVPVTMIGLDVTHQSIPTMADLQRIQAIGTPVSRMVEQMLDFFGRTYRETFGFPGPPLHDAVAVAQVIDPTLVQTRRVNVAIETRGHYTDGMTVCDLHGVTGRLPNADVGLTLDRQRFWDLLIDGLARYG
jgi:purine nucleosidase